MLESLPQSQWTRASADHLLRRGGFGGSPAQRDAFYRLGQRGGVLRAVDSLLNEGGDLATFEYPDWTEFDTDGSPVPVTDRPGEGPHPSIVEGSPFDPTAKFASLDEWYLRHMLEGVPVAGKMFKFLVDHFPVDHRRMYGDRVFRYALRHFDLLRRFSLGNFGELVKEVARSAMMMMLDVHVNKKQSINENFGRELLELFTMGVSGGYTEPDVLVAAKAFTGQVFGLRHPHAALNIGQYIDGSEKTLLGQRLDAFEPGLHVTSKENHGPAAIDIVLQQPATARHMVWKLWRYFVSERPDEALLNGLADRFRRDYDYEFKPLLREILSSRAFFDAVHQLRQVKDPVDYIVTATRQLEVPLLPSHTLHFALEEMGMGLLTPPSIAGWPEPIGSGNQWLGAGALISRLNLPAVWLSGNELVLKSSRLIPRSGTPLAELPLPELSLAHLVPKSLRGRGNLNRLIDALVDRFLPGGQLSVQQRRALFDFADRTNQFSENAEDENIREMIRLLMAMPEYQLQ